MKTKKTIGNRIKQSVKRITALGAAGSLALLLTATPLSFLVSSDARAASAVGYNGRIALEYDPPLDSVSVYGGIFSIQYDGTGLSRLAVPESDSLSMDPKWSPDGTMIAYGHDGELFIMDSDGSNKHNVDVSAPFAGEWSFSNFYWSPDSKMIVYERLGVIRIVSVQSGEVLTAPAGGYIEHFDWSPDGEAIAFTLMSNGGQIQTLNIMDLSTAQIAVGDGRASMPRWDDSGRNIYYLHDSTEVRIIRADGENDRLILRPKDEKVGYHYYMISPDGSSIAALDRSFSKLIIAKSDGSEVQEYNSSQTGIQEVEYLLWSPDSEQILLIGYSDDYWSIGQYQIFNVKTKDHYTLLGDRMTSDGGLWYADWQPIPNTPPVTTNDSLSVAFNTPSSIDVLANDTDEEALDAQYLTIKTPPAHGTASIKDGKVLYTPNSGYQGADQLTYQICDSFLLDQKCATGEVNITVEAPGAPTLNVNKVDGATFTPSAKSYTSNTRRPTFSGTATPGATVTVEIHSDPIVLTTVAGSDGNWSVAPTFDLPAGDHMVYISATSNGLTTELGAFGLTVQAELASTGMNMWMAASIAAGPLLSGALVMARARLARAY